MHALPIINPCFALNAQNALTRMAQEETSHVRLAPTMAPPPMSPAAEESASERPFSRPEARGDSYLPPSPTSQREALLPFGPAIEDRTVIMSGFQAINSGREARKYLELIEAGNLELLKTMLQSAAMVADAWEELQWSAKKGEK